MQSKAESGSYQIQLDTTVDMIMMFINARPRYNFHILLTQAGVS